MDLNENEQLLLSGLKAEHMTDEESEVDEHGNKTLTRRKLTWRSESLDTLIIKLDAPSLSSARALMFRREGAPSTWQPSAGTQAIYLKTVNSDAE